MSQPPGGAALEVAVAGSSLASASGGSAIVPATAKEVPILK